MPCYKPLTAYYSRVIGSSGKRGITFQRSLSFSGAALKVPCGRCVGCRLEKSRQWAMRILHEKKLHKDNCFVTLTYDNEHLPKFGNLVKRDLQLFIKRLRNEHGAGIRFYGCGEYGDNNMRPHYHVIIFNYAPQDKRLYKYAKRGEPLYTSASLSAIWGAGFVVIGDVSFDSAAYVARYVMKKQTGKNEHYYDVVDGNGEVFRRNPEFALMSRRPGIGTGWYEKYGKETYTHDNVVINGRKVRPPRFYDGKYERENPSDLERLKKLRKRKAALQFRENLVDRLRVRERVTEINMKLLKRSV